MKNLKRRILAIGLSISFLLMGTSVLFASATSPPTPVIPVQCTTPSMGGIATYWSALPIVNAQMTVKNDEDAGNVGYWALDTYVKSFIIWQNTGTNPNTFCALVQYSGTWTTFAGALSPENGVSEPVKGHGPMTEAYVAIFTGTFGPAVKTTGSIGTFNYGGTQADILLGTYASQAGIPHYTSIYALYFSSHAGFTYLAESAIYTLGFGVGYGNFFVSSSMSSTADNIGDIITSSPFTSPAPVIPAQCTNSSMGGIATGWSASPIVNAKMTVKNDEDSGNNGNYWALDNYVKSFIIWQNTGTNPVTYCSLVQYSGTWTTFAGTLSPFNEIAEPSGGHGPMTEAYVATFTGTLAPMFVSTGSIGAFNDGGTKSDLLLPPANQAGDATTVSIYRLYFEPHAGFTYLAESAIYTLGSGVGYGNFFVSSPITSAADIGDIVS